MDIIFLKGFFHFFILSFLLLTCESNVNTGNIQEHCCPTEIYHLLDRHALHYTFILLRRRPVLTPSPKWSSVQPYYHQEGVRHPFAMRKRYTPVLPIPFCQAAVAPTRYREATPEALSIQNEIMY